ncbi:conjugal transfer protein TraI [Mucilaginibacter sp. R-33]|uniref:conjugal transfer protein TraI n=1 Tax=Mucilaginibacter sp. R-33 TaxID=3416711 RepID=UPI003CF769FA
MKRKTTILLFICCLLSLSSTGVKAQIPVVSAFTGLVKRVIVAIDLKVQRLQNQTIGLQNAARKLENTLHLNSLNDICGWLDKEKQLYANYYEELNRVRGLIAGFNEVKTIITRQQRLVSEYQQASGLFSRDPHFSPAELHYMGTVYNGILQESLRNLDELLLAVSSFSTQMDDAERLQKIAQASRAMQTNLDHLRQFNRQNAGLSYLRARDARERAAVKQLYGIN